jgi:hypothetical protein
MEQFGEFNEGIPRETLEKLAKVCLRQPNNGEVVTFQPDGSVNVLRLIKTGETELITFHDGEEIHAFEKAVEEPILNKHFDSLDAYAKGHRASYEVPKLYRGFREVIHNNEYDGLKDSILAACEEATATTSHEELIDECGGCTDGVVVGDCDCARRDPSSYTDIEGNSVSSDKDIDQKIDCAGCGGMGVREYRCMGCLGAGLIVQNPLLSVVNHETGESVSMPLDAPLLVTTGLVDILISDAARRRSTNKEQEISISLDVLPLIEAMGSGVGIDVTKGNFTTYWGGRPLETFGTSFGKLLEYPVVHVKKSEQPNIPGIIDDIQKRLRACLRIDMYTHNFDIYRNATNDQIKQLAEQFDIFMNEDLTIHEIGLRIEQSKSVYENLQAAINILGQHDLRLGYAVTGVAMGETGPAFYILDAQGNVLLEIESGYSAETVLDKVVIKLRTAHEKGLFD